MPRFAHLFAVLAALALAACLPDPNELKPAETPAPNMTPAQKSPAGTGAMCAGMTAADACDTCFFQSCCKEFEACLKDPECKALFECSQKCGGATTCTKDCVQRYPGGVNKLLPASGCVEKACPKMCG